jgi:hypothetical protein
MKKMHSLLVIASLLTSQVSLATPQLSQPTRKTAAAALILKADGQLPAEDSIPANAVEKPEIAVPENKIMEGKPVNMDAPLKPEFIVQ